MLIEQINKWFKGYKKYFITYSKGFYNIPYLANSPETMVASMEKLPFVAHTKNYQLLKGKTLFLVGNVYYQKIEEGLWLIYSTAKYKANVSYNLIYDDYLPNDYYMISLNLASSEVAVSKQFRGQKINLPKYSWNFFKPNHTLADINFKGTDSKYITFYFNEKWLSNNLLSSSVFKTLGLKDFIESENSFLIQSLSEKNISNEFEDFDKLVNIDRNIKKLDLFGLKSQTINLLFKLFNLYEIDDSERSINQLTTKDRLVIYKIEKSLLDNLEHKFMGIEVLSAKFALSESKLKKDFKKTFGKPVYQYFQEKQMLLAKKLLQENNLIIKEIANKLGYENTSKFTAAFKKHNGILPSEI